MASLTYSLCSVVAAICAWLLLAAWRRSQHRLLFWSGLCFVGFSVNNLLLLLDKVFYPDVDLSVPRTAVGLLSIAVLLFGLIWDAK